MKSPTRCGARIALTIVAMMALALYLGCGGDDTKTSEEMQQQQEMETTPYQDTVPTDTIPQDTMQAAMDTEVAGAETWAAYANPKKGICPVCAMTLDAEHVEVAEISDKKYACCSSHCATTLAENPDKYLKASEESHEGHGH